MDEDTSARRSTQRGLEEDSRSWNGLEEESPRRMRTRGKVRRVRRD